MVTGESPAMKMFYTEFSKYYHARYDDFHDYLRLEIAMHIFMIVQNEHRLQNLLRYPLCHTLLQRTDGSNITLQISSGHVLHRDVCILEFVPGVKVDKKPPVLHTRSQIRTPILYDKIFRVGELTSFKNNMELISREIALGVPCLSIFTARSALLLVCSCKNTEPEPPCPSTDFRTHTPIWPVAAEPPVRWVVVLVLPPSSTVPSIL